MLFGVEQIGLGAPDFGSVANILDPIILVPKTDALHRHAELGFGLRQQVLLLLIGNADEYLPFVYAIPEIGIRLRQLCRRFQR